MYPPIGRLLLVASRRNPTSLVGKIRLVPGGHVSVSKPILLRRDAGQHFDLRIHRYFSSSSIRRGLDGEMMSGSSQIDQPLGNIFVVHSAGTPPLNVQMLDNVKSTSTVHEYIFQSPVAEPVENVTEILQNTDLSLEEAVGHTESITTGITEETITSESQLLVETTATNSVEKLDSTFIPEPPPIPEAPISPPAAVNDFVSNLSEPSFAEIGLGGWSPAGWVENAMEWLHISMDMPWWGCILAGTVTVRCVLFPLVILAQRNAAKMANNMPQLTLLQMKVTQARQSGNALEAARLSNEMVVFFREKEINPLKNLVVPLAQLPFFMSFFFALRNMANTPVASMQTGGLYWFSDLTMCDPYYALPVMTSLTMWAVIELGTDSARMSGQNMQLMKYFLRAMPVAMLIFTCNFPAALLFYWASTNVFSLAQVGLLRLPAVREFFKIEKINVLTAQVIPTKKMGFVESAKEAWTNSKITRELEDRQRLNEANFRRSGSGPVQKTYKYDPTRQSAQQIAQRGFSEANKKH